MQRNGIEIDLVDATAEAIRQDHDNGAVSVRVRHRWRDGFAVTGEVEELRQGGHALARDHTFRTDWPAPFSRDTGPTPGAEAVLAALGACVTTTAVIQAARQDVALDGLEVVVTADLHLAGLFAVGDERPFPGSVTATLHIDSDADDAALERLVDATWRTSPVVDALTSPTPVELRVERLERSHA